MEKRFGDFFCRYIQLYEHDFGVSTFMVRRIGGVPRKLSITSRWRQSATYIAEVAALIIIIIYLRIQMYRTQNRKPMLMIDTEFTDTVDHTQGFFSRQTIGIYTLHAL